MIKKSLLVSVISFLFLLIVSFLIEGLDEIAKEYPLQYLLQVLILGALPFIGIGFVVLIVFNLITEKLIVNKTKKQKENAYWFLGIAASLIPILGFVVYDISDYGKYYDSTFLQMLYKYSPFFILSFTALVLNRRIVWKNFRE